MKKPFLDFIENFKALSSCPLAFSELGVKSRIKTILNYKKPSFYLVIVTFVACIVVGFCFFTSPERKLNEDIADSNEKTFEESVAEFKENFPDSEDIESIDLVTGNGPVRACLKTITDRADIETIRDLFTDMVFVRMAEEEETQIIGGLSPHLFFRLNNGQVLYLIALYDNVLVYNDTAYIVEYAGSENVHLSLHNDLWEQLDYREFHIGGTGLSAMKENNYTNEILYMKYTYSGNLETSLDIDEFAIYLKPDGTYFYRAMRSPALSSPDVSYEIGGNWYVKDDRLKLVENEGEENERVNYFSYNKGDICYKRYESDGFDRIMVYYYERFYVDVRTK